MTGFSTAIRKVRAIQSLFWCVENYVYQGSQLSDSVLGVTTPGRYIFRGGVYYYDNLTSTMPMSTDDEDRQLGLTRTFSVPASVGSSIEGQNAPIPNTPDELDSIYGEQ